MLMNVITYFGGGLVRNTLEWDQTGNTILDKVALRSFRDPVGRDSLRASFSSREGVTSTVRG